MRFYTLTSGKINSNVYILVNGTTDNATVIDCGEDYALLSAFLREKNVKVTDLLLTHGHFDHAGCCRKMQENGAKIHIHEYDSQMLSSASNLGKYFGYKFQNAAADRFLCDGETVKTDGFEFRVIHTPGHTRGSCCFICGDMLFSGDTLFCGSIGRTDFPGGSVTEMQNSLKKLRSLTKNYDIFPGHGEKTVLSAEKENNPYLTE